MKKQRQSKIIDIISKNEISTQAMLKKYLEDSGIKVTQATLSRDINELDLRKKTSQSGVSVYVCKPNDSIKFPSIFKEAVIGTDYALNTVVIKCHAGMAQAACAALDKINRSEIVGTIAGDDTIFVLMRTETAAEDFYEALKGFKEK